MEGVFACVGRIVNYPQITQILLFVSVNLLSYETRELVGSSFQARRATRTGRVLRQSCPC